MDPGRSRRLFVGRHLRGGSNCLLNSSDNMAALKIRRWAASGHLVKMAASSHHLIFSEIEFILENFKMSTAKHTEHSSSQASPGLLKKLLEIVLESIYLTED